MFRKFWTFRLIFNAIFPISAPIFKQQHKQFVHEIINEKGIEIKLKKTKIETEWKNWKRALV